MRKILFVLICLAFSNLLLAQKSTNPKRFIEQKNLKGKGKKRTRMDEMLRTGVHLGLYGNMNSTWIVNQNNFGTLFKFQEPIVRQSDMAYTFTMGSNIGADFSWNFHKKWGLAVQPTYNWAGQNYLDDFQGGVGNPNSADTSEAWFVKKSIYVNVKRTVRLHYFQLPILLRFQGKVGPMCNVYLQAGPQIGFRTFVSEEVRIKDALYLDKYSGLTTAQKFNKFDAGLVFNFGFDIFPKEWMFFNIGLTSYYGLTDINGATLKNLDWFSKNRIQYQKSNIFRGGLQLGVHFFLKKKEEYGKNNLKNKKK